MLRHGQNCHIANQKHFLEINRWEAHFRELKNATKIIFFPLCRGSGGQNKMFIKKELGKNNGDRQGKYWVGVNFIHGWWEAKYLVFTEWTHFGFYTNKILLEMVEIYGQASI